MIKRWCVLLLFTALGGIMYLIWGSLLGALLSTTDSKISHWLSLSTPVMPLILMKRWGQSYIYVGVTLVTGGIVSAITTEKRGRKNDAK